MGIRVRELVKEVCKRNSVEILRGHVSRDHVHLFVSAPPSLAVSKLIQYLKGKSSHELMQANKQLSKLFWVIMYGLEVILEYIKNQDDNEVSNEEFTKVD